MDDFLDAPPEKPSAGSADRRRASGPGINRRDLFKLTVAGGSGLALGELLDVRAMRAATAGLKLSDISEFTTSCNFCSCGCGMVAAVRDGKLMKMEGDYDHIVNRGALCVKGISMFATHTSPKRLTVPLYRAPGSDRWEELSWEDAVSRVARKIRKTRDESWIATEMVDAPVLVGGTPAAEDPRRANPPRFAPRQDGKGEVPVNRTDAIGFMGGAQNTNEECYLFQKAARLLGLSYVEHQARL